MLKFASIFNFNPYNNRGNNINTDKIKCYKQTNNKQARHVCGLMVIHTILVYMIS